MADDRDAHGWTTSVGPVDNAELRARAEAHIDPLPTEKIESFSALEVGNFLHELQVHQIELEMQNEELRRAQEALEISRARYFDLYNLAPVGYVTVSQQGLVLESNLTLATLLAVPRNRLDKSRLSQYILPADQDGYYYFHRRLQESSDSQVCELRMLRKDSEPFWARLDGLPQEDAGASVYRIAVSDISDYRQTEQIKHALEQKETLLRELYHRTKNNMLVLSSVLVLKARHSKNTETRAELLDLQGKVQSMALVHEKLYRSQDLSNIDLGEYIPELLALLLKNHQIAPPQISTRLKVAHIFVVLDVAIPCGLILNELVSNAIKHGFHGQDVGELQIELDRLENGDVLLTFSDNGVGVPDDFDFNNRSTLGLRTIIAIVTHQLQGTIRFESKSGITCRILFPDTNYVARI